MEIVSMVHVLAIRESKRTAEALLRMMLDRGHIDEEGLFSIPLETWEIDLLSCYGAADIDLEDSDDDEDESQL